MAAKRGLYKHTDTDRDELMGFTYVATHSHIHTLTVIASPPKSDLTNKRDFHMKKKKIQTRVIFFIIHYNTDYLSFLNNNNPNSEK